MCAPPPLLAAAAGAAQVFGTVMGGISEAGTANANAKIAANNRTYAERQALDALEQGEEQAVIRGRQFARLRGEQAVAKAASGLYGASHDRIDDDTDLIAREDMDALRRGASRQSQGYRIDALNYEMERRMQKRQAKFATARTVFDVGSTILGTATQIQGMPGGWSSLKGR